jgi:hypothetical protein
MVAALKLETRGDPVRGLAVVLLGGFDVTMGDLFVVLRVLLHRCPRGLGEEELGHGEARGERG